jgi:hypothetical protein
MPDLRLSCRSGFQPRQVYRGWKPLLQSKETQRSDSRTAAHELVREYVSLMLSFVAAFSDSLPA